MPAHIANDSGECIICGNIITEKSVEHVLPDSVGGKTTITTVCKRCNNRLGEKVESLLTEDPAIRFLRARYCIPNRDGNIINMISFLKQGRFSDEEGKKLAIKDGDGKTMPCHYVGNPTPEIHIECKNGNLMSVKWSAMDFESAFKAAKRKLVKEGIIIPDEQLRSFMGSSVNGSMDYVVLQTGIVSHQENYIPCVIKIAYEAMTAISPDYWKSDLLGKRIREYLLTIINGATISDVVLPVEVVANNDFNRTSNCHILIFRKTNESVFADLNLFGSLHHSVLLSNNPELYGTLEDKTAYFLT